MNGLESACALVPGDIHLGTTGAEVGGWIVLGGIAVAFGVVLLLLALVLRRRRGAPRAARVAVGALLVLALFGGAQGAPAPASAATAGGCDLIGWSMLTAFPTGAEATLSEDPTDVVAFTLKNVSNVPIGLKLRTDIKSDPANLAPFVQILADCPACTPASVYLAAMGHADPGPEFTLAAGESVDISFSAQLLPGLGNDAQNTSATFGISAIARQI